MNYLFSLWTKPLFNDPAWKTDNDWLINQLRLWTLSVNLITQQRDAGRIILYTDKLGYEILVKKLSLPFTDCHLFNSDELHVPNNYWNYAKIVALKMYGEMYDDPCIHLDNDHLQFSHFPRMFKDADIIGLCPHRVFPGAMWYRDLIKFLLSQNFDFTEEETSDYKDILNWHSICCGIMGFKNSSVIDQYTSRSLSFLKRLMTIPLHLYCNPYDFNCLFEQWMLALTAKVCNYKVAYLSTGIEAPHQQRRLFFHPYGPRKNSAGTQQFVEKELITHFPASFIQVKQLITR